MPSITGLWYDCICRRELSRVPTLLFWYEWKHERKLKDKMAAASFCAYDSFWKIEKTRARMNGQIPVAQRYAKKIGNLVLNVRAWFPKKKIKRHPKVSNFNKYLKESRNSLNIASCLAYINIRWKFLFEMHKKKQNRFYRKFMFCKFSILSQFSVVTF